MHQRFAHFGLGDEAFSENFPMVAFNAPAGADFAGIKLVDLGPFSPNRTSPARNANTLPAGHA